MPVLRRFALCLCALPVLAQQPAGMAPEWDVRVILNELAAQADRLQPVFNQIDAKAWVAKGASETYSVQLESCKAQARALAGGARALAQKPDVLPAALELYFRMQGLDHMIGSLMEGIRRYQNPAVAELLAGVAAEGGANRERFLRFLLDLAAEREQQFSVMDREAQRCRGMLARQPVEPPKTTGGKK